MKALLKESGNNSPKLKSYKTSEPCLVCLGHTENGNTLHHLITQKNRGPDEPWNLMPLCTPHHNEIHSIGRTSFAGKYVTAREWLIKNGWEYLKLTHKWGIHADSKI